MHETEPGTDKITRKGLENMVGGAQLPDTVDSAVGEVTGDFVDKNLAITALSDADELAFEVGGVMKFKLQHRPTV